MRRVYSRPDIRQRELGQIYSHYLSADNLLFQCTYLLEQNKMTNLKLKGVTHEKDYRSSAVRGCLSGIRFRCFCPNMSAIWQWRPLWTVFAQRVQLCCEWWPS